MKVKLPFKWPPDFSRLKTSAARVWEKIPLDKLVEKLPLEALREKWEPIKSKLPLDKLPKPKCRSCKSMDYKPSHRNGPEKVLSNILPIRPYRCNECDTRFYGPTVPLINLGHGITLSGFFFLAMFFVMSSPGPEVPPVNPSAEVNSASELTSEEPIEAELLAGEEQLQDEAQSPGTEVSELSPPMEAPPTTSDFVMAQAAQNRAKRDGSYIAPAVKTKSAVTANPETKVVINESASQAKKLLQKIEQGVEGNTLQLTILHEGGPAKTKILKLSEGGRWAVDLEGMWRIPRGLDQKRKSNHDHIKQIRFGNHSGFFRIVFDLVSPSPDPPIIEAKAGKLIISLTI